ncbi:MAG: BatD family protein [Puia sp.]
MASLNIKEVDTGDAANLSVSVKGTGNLPVINAPVISWPANMESYDVSNKENIDKTVAPLGGTKTYSYSFICTKPGKYILPPVKMSYFDPSAKVYKTIESDPLNLTVKASIKKKAAKPREVPVQTNQVEWTKYALWGSAFLFLAMATYFIIRESKKDALLKAEKAKQLAELEKAKQVPKVIDPLDESRQLMQAGDFSKFYASVIGPSGKQCLTNFSYLPAI